MIKSDATNIKRAIGICVDDFGMHDGINEAALDLAGKQRISAISCMVDGPVWLSGSSALQQIDAKVEIGLHLNLTEDFGQAVVYPSLAGLIVRAYLHLLDRKSIRQEIERQFDKFEHAMGRLPDFVDGHQHVHQLPVIRELLIDVMDSRFGLAKPWLRSSCSTTMKNESGLPLGTRIKSHLIGLLGSRRFGALARQHGYMQNRRLLGIYGFDLSEAGYLESLRAWLDCAQDGDLLMCHPSLGGSKPDPLLLARRMEYHVLAGEVFAAMLKSTGVEIGRLANLKIK